jgi:hypothetical protein
LILPKGDAKLFNFFSVLCILLALALLEPVAAAAAGLKFTSSEKAVRQLYERWCKHFKVGASKKRRSTASPTSTRRCTASRPVLFELQTSLCDSTVSRTRDGQNLKRAGVA